MRARFWLVECVVIAVLAGPLHGAGTIRGRVTDAGGGGIASVDIHAYAQYNFEVYATTTTGADGRYEFAAIADGRYRLETDSGDRDYVDEWYSNIPVTGHEPPYSAALVTVTSGGTVTADFSLSTGGAIRGVVRDDLGVALTNASLWVCLADAEFDGIFVYAGSGGAYVVHGLPPGDWCVWASDGNPGAPAHGAQWFRGLPACGSIDMPAPAAAERVHVTPGGTVSDVDFALTRFATFRGRVVGPGDNPERIENVLICGPADGCGSGEHVAQTDGNGYFQATDLTPGTYVLRTDLTHSGLANEWYGGEYVTSAEPPAGAVQVVAVAGGVVSNLDFVLSYGGKIEGRVVDAGGSKIGGAQVQVCTPSGYRLGDDWAGGSSGEYWVQGLPAGTYYVRASVGGANAGLYPSQWYRGVVSESTNAPAGATAVEVNLGDVTGGIDFVLTRIPVPPATRYVRAGNPGAQAPFTNWTTAAAAIQDAVDVALAGDTVVVSNGTYATGGALPPGQSTWTRVCVTQAVSLVAAPGGGRPTIVGNAYVGPSGVRCAYLSSGASLSGFVLRSGGAGEGWDDSDRGGGAFLDDASISNCLVTACVASHGAGVYCRGASLVRACEVTSNACVAVSGAAEGPEGGGILCDVAGYPYGEFREPRVEDCRIDGNSTGPGPAGSGGGGVCCRHGGVVERCTISDNEANYGGGAYLYDGGTLQDCVVSSNRATDNVGGGAYVYYGRLRRCTLLGNRAVNGAGAYLHYGGEALGCVFVLNEAEHGGGGVWLSSAGAILNCTVARNASDAGGGVYSDGGRAVNSIVVLNQAAGAGTNYWPDGAAGLFEASCTRPLPEGNRNTDADPLFANAASLDFHLTIASPCIDAGATADMPDADRDGRGRPLDGDCDGWTDWDMGAYEVMCAAADSDGDGHSDGVETNADTDPADAASVLALCGVSVDGGDVLVRWHGGRQARQYVERRQSLTDTSAPWTPIATNHPPTAVTNLLRVGWGSSTSGYFRVRAARP